MSLRHTLTIVLAVISASGVGAVAATRAEVAPRVDVIRIPDAGVQPDVVVDATGTLHMVYLTGEPSAADIYYTTSRDGGQSFAPRTRVNSQPGSAVATGTIRGAHLALGRDGRVHVVWNGSGQARPMPPVLGDQKPGMPLLYARSVTGAPGAAATFEPQRNLMTTTRHLDGGPSVAANDAGAVYVAWHGNALDGPEGEQARRVWLAVSVDDGQTFGRERAISPASTGACGCCGLRVMASANTVHVLYRGARAQVHRDIHALTSEDAGATFATRQVDAWEIGACPMSSMSITRAAATTYYAWEHDGQVAFSAGAATSAPTAIDARDPKARRKHPRLAVAPDGQVLMAWATGTGWNKGGGVGWQLFADGVPVGPVQGRDGLPVWSFPAVAAVGERFLLLY
ncbi:hypothetical protein [Luteitalea sp.]